MKQWVAVLSLIVGILVGKCGVLPLAWLLAGLGLGVLMLVLQYWRKGSPWLTLVWNVMLVGAIWCTLRQEMKQGEDDEPTLVERLSVKASAYAHDCWQQSGLAQADMAVLQAMLLGDRTLLTRDQKMQFRQAGVQHLLALSGLHLGILIAVLSFLYLRRMRHSRWRWAVLLLTLMVMWGYGLLTGMPQSLLRAMLMTTFFYINMFAYREGNGGIILVNTLLIMLLLDPLALFDIGTQLSFAAVAALLWLYPVLQGILPYALFPVNRWGRCLHGMWQMLMLSVTAWLGTMPLCLWYFGQFQPWQPLVSVLLVPLTTVLLYLALFLLLLSVCGLWILAKPFACVVGWVMQVENWALERASELPLGMMKCEGIHPGHVLMLYLLLVVMTIGITATPRARRYCYAVAMAGLVMLFLL